MSEIVNLRRARKARTRQAAQSAAAENRVKFGRSKARKNAEAAESKRAQRTLDQARREP